MIGDILPAKVRFAEAYDDVAGVTLFPEEEAVISKAVAKRRREFTTVRHCARQALAELGYPPRPLVPGERGAPTWPDGVAGSMTHCAGYRAAAVAHRADFASVGIDAEPNAPLPDGVLDTIALPEERERVQRLDVVHTDVHWGRLLFSAKESVYKAWFPRTRTWLGFEHAAIDIDPEAATLCARVLVNQRDDRGHAVREFHGRWIVHNGLIITAIAQDAAE